MASRINIIKSFGWTIVAAFLASAAAGAAPRTARIHYAEAVNLAGIPALAPSGVQKPGLSVQTSFEAYGRRFDLQLESNERLLHGLSSAGRKALPSHALYAGTVAGLPGSWVRLTRLKDGLHGLVYDGSELYVVAPASSVERELDAAVPGASGSTTLVYRAADAESGLGADFCKVLTPPPGASPVSKSNRRPDYKTVFAELQSYAPEIVAAVPTKELDLALVADPQFASQFASPSGEMLARLNNVDGIFSAQVGVKVVSGFVKVLTSDSGLTSTAPETLLDQFESYRKVTPEASSRGLAHLMTSRELDGSTVGIAYMSTLCASQFAVSLSQTYVDTFYSSLVAAHEIGHNFGAPHDGVGGACSATPQSYLMSPFINGSSTFSSCSLSQIAPVVGAAACLAAKTYADVAANIAQTTYGGYARQEVHVPVSVESRGSTGAGSVVLTLTRNGYMSISSATVAGGTCSASGLDVTCQLGSMAAGETRQVDVVVTDHEVENATLRATVSTAGDADAGNDVDSATVSFASPADGTVAASPFAVSALAGQPLSFSVTVANAGPLALLDATVSVPISVPLTVNSVSGTGVTCTLPFAEIRCTVGTLPAGESRRIDVTVTASSAWNQSLGVSLQSSNDYLTTNNFASVLLTASPLVELALAQVAGASVVPVANTVTQSFIVQSIGPQPASGVSFQLSMGSGIEVVSLAGTGAQCGQADATTYRCTYASAIESGGSRTIDATLRGKTPGFTQAIARVSSPDNQHLPGGGVADTISVGYQVKELIDVRVLASPTYGAFDHRSMQVFFQVESLGATPAPGTNFRLTLPAGVRALSAESGLGSCTYSTGSVNCAIGTLNPGATTWVRVGLQSDATGTYTLASQAAATGDLDPSNDAATTSLTVQPNLDVSVATAPATPRVRLGATLDYVVTVAAASQPVSGVQASLFVGSGVTILGATPTQGTCTATASSVACDIGALPANGTSTVTVRLRGDAVGSVYASVSATATGDVDGSNGSAGTLVTVEARGDVAVTSSASSPAATVGQTFTLPAVTITAVTTSDDVRATVAIPAAFSIVSATADGAPCSVDAGTVSCAFGTLGAGTRRGINVQLRANQSGSFSVGLQATAADDSDTSNNATSIAVTVSPSSSGSGGGSGGGGGALDPATLLWLVLAPAALARRRRPG